MNDFSYASPSSDLYGSGSDVMSGISAGLGGILIAVILFYGVVFLYTILAYVLQSISLHTIAKRRGISYPWLAWIPFGTNWILGAIACDYDKRNGVKRRWDKLLLILSIVIVAIVVIVEVILFVSLFMTIVNASTASAPDKEILILVILMSLAILPVSLLTGIFVMLQTICVFKLFESTVPQKALTYFLIYLLVPFAAPICLFACRNQGYEIEQTPLAFEPVGIQSTTVVQENIEQVDTE